MKMQHLIIEGFCDGNEKLNIYPCNGELRFGIHCFKCPKFSYTYCPNEIALSNSEGVVEEYIGFGGIMEPLEVERRDEYIEVWNKICKEKIDEAYNEYLRQFDINE